MKNRENLTIEKLETGIPGFDWIADGGLSKGRATLVTGSPGNGKSVFAAQFLAEGIQKANENGVFVTFEESPQDIRQNMLSFGWDILKWEQEGKWAFVDASPNPETEIVVGRGYDLSALLARIQHAIQKVNAKRVSMDSLGAIFAQFSNLALVRSEMFRIITCMKELNVSTIMTGELTKESRELSRSGVEEFVCDNVVIMRNCLDEEKRRKTIEILKLRGASHQKGEFPFIIQGKGIKVIPLGSINLNPNSSNLRVSSGNLELDQMCGGGFFRDSILLVSGVTGTGKTLLCTEFVKGGIANREKCLLFSFEESREQLIRNASNWGVDFQAAEKAGNLKVISDCPETTGIEEHLIKMKTAVEEFKPKRIAVDSLSALGRIACAKHFREAVISFSSYIKQQEAIGLFTSTITNLTGASSSSEEHIITMTDTIILLKYVEVFGEMRRGITVLKMRGSLHDKEIRVFTIDSNGMQIGKPFRNITGILGGTPRFLTSDEMERLDEMFKEKTVKV